MPVDDLKLKTLLIALILIGIVGFSLTTFAKVNNTIRVGGQTKDSVVNETVSISSLPAVFANSLLDNGTIVVENITDEANNVQVVIPSAEYGIDADNGEIEVMNNTAWGPNVNVSYSFIVRNAMFNVSLSTADSYAVVASNMGIIGLIAILVILVGMFFFIAVKVNVF